MDCLQPVRITIAGRVYKVPCRCCYACQLNARSHRVTRAQNVVGSGYRALVTLTYDNEHLPVVYPAGLGTVQLFRGIGTNNFISYVPTELTYNSDDLQRPVSHYSNGHAVLTTSCCQAVLWPDDLQKFLKRIRITLDRHFIHTNYDSKIKFFAVGEYGPTSYRPHFHIIFSASSSEVLLYLQQTLHKVWPYCSNQGLNFQHITGDCTNYVAGYVNGFDFCNGLLSERKFRQFHRGSQQTLHEKLEKIKLSDENCTQILFSTKGKSYESFFTSLGSSFSRADANQLCKFQFPKGFDSLSSCEVVKLYDYYSSGKENRAVSDVNLTLDGIISNSAFSYQNYNFYRCMNYFLNHGIDVNLFVNGVPRETIHIGFTKQTYVQFLYDLRSYFELSSLKERFVTILSSNYDDLLFLYRDFLELLPTSLTKEQFTFRYGESWHFLPYDFLYSDNSLKVHFIQSVIDKHLSDRRKSAKNKILQLTKKKKYNSSLNNNL